MAGPLSSLKVLDFSTLLPGPFASMVLADLGADIVRVESPTRGDPVQFLPPQAGKVSAAHTTINRSKRSIAVDLKKEKGKDVIKELVKDFDIVIEQFRPGVMNRLGVGYEDLKKINPSLIYCSITGYGQTGPYKDRAGHDINYLAIAGAASYTGRKSQGPTPFSLQVADIAGGSFHSVMGVLAAVIHRQQTGEGQHIDISMTDAAFSMHALTAPGFLAEGTAFEPDYETTILNGGHYYDYYPTKDGRYISVGSLEPQFFSQFIAAAKLGDIIGNGDMNEQKTKIREVFASKTFDEWNEIFIKLDACVEPVLKLSEACEHPHMKARNMLTEVPDNNGGTFTQIASAFKFSASKPEYKFAGVAAGTHTEEVLKEAGVDDAKIAEFKANDAIK
jgi:crotonobetainyl-CoA:carnitine CoA-transferase CaiB-like acyl-CoA transferase